MPPLNSHSLSSAIDQYQGVRDAVYEFTEQAFSQHALSLSGISWSDAVQADAWRWGNPEKGACWQWKMLYQTYTSRKGFMRFDLAIKSGGRLCGLCYGIQSKRKLILKLHALSGAPSNDRLKGKILPIVLYAANAYARLLGAEQIWLCNPVSAGVVKLYGEFGFQSNSTRIGNVTHMSKEVSR